VKEPVKQRIAEYIGSHRYLALATAGPDGSPVVHAMGYVAVGDVVYCSSYRDRRKVRNIVQRSDVAYAIHDHCDEPERIRGVQMLGKAALVQDPTEISKAVELMSKVFPPFARRYPSDDIVFIRIEPVEALLIDFAVSLDHSERVTY
jgi:nitroimidazol reductase NimA-like FMN-containing flavoprotein (pyridoxamine 5'-phosphate oxidase superfamily)